MRSSPLKNTASSSVSRPQQRTLTQIRASSASRRTQSLGIEVSGQLGAKSRWVVPVASITRLAPRIAQPPAVTEPKQPRIVTALGRQASLTVPAFHLIDGPVQRLEIRLILSHQILKTPLVLPSRLVIDLDILARIQDHAAAAGYSSVNVRTDRRWALNLRYQTNRANARNAVPRLLLKEEVLSQSPAPVEHVTTVPDDPASVRLGKLPQECLDVQPRRDSLAVRLQRGEHQPFRVALPIGRPPTPHLRLPLEVATDGLHRPPSPP